MARTERMRDLTVQEDAARAERMMDLTVQEDAARTERLRDLTVPEDAARYLRARGVLSELREMYRRRRITAQQYRTMRGQAVAGDVDGAVKGLARILREKGVEAE